jgi:ketosteroid isomerase-like protein
MPAVMDNLALVQDILDRMLPAADLDPLLHHLADDVVFTLAASDAGPEAQATIGKSAVRDYFAALGDLIAFWKVKSSWSGGRVVVLAEERFIIQPCDIAAQGELALIFDLEEGLITRLMVVEDPSASEAWAQPQLLVDIEALTAECSCPAG